MFKNVLQSVLHVCLWSNHKSEFNKTYEFLLRNARLQLYVCLSLFAALHFFHYFSEVFDVRGLLEKYPTFGREKETGLLGALDT